MAVVKELIVSNEDGKISFGNYKLEEKTKLSDFEYCGDLYKVKTFKDITRLEKNGMFVYESVPGTAVNNLAVTDQEVCFDVEGLEDSQITVELESEAEYKVYIDDTNVGKMKTNLGGKLSFSVELSEGKSSTVKIKKA